MLRFAVIVLLLANAGYYAWSQGLLHQWGYEPEDQSEAHRFAEQIRPETLQILRATSHGTGAPGQGADQASNAGSAPNVFTPPPQAPASASHTAAAEEPAAAKPGECLQAGVFDERQANALRSVASNLPSGSWSLDTTPLPGRWMVYMGRFPDLETLDKKRAELRAMKLSVDRAGGTWEYGLSLGRFASEEAAKRELATLSNKGVRTARVLQERPDTTGYMLRLPAVTDGLRARLDVLRPAMAGRTLRSCS